MKRLNFMFLVVLILALTLTGCDLFEEDPVIPDSWESDDEVESSTLLTVGETQLHNLHDENDKDYFYINGVAGTTYHIALSIPEGSSTKAMLHLYTEDLHTLAYASNDSQSSTAYTNYTVVITNTYRIRVTTSYDSYYGEYYISLSEVAP